MLYCWPRIRLNLNLPGIQSTTYLSESDTADPTLLQTHTDDQKLPPLGIQQLLDTFDLFYARIYPDLPLFILEIFEICPALSHASVSGDLDRQCDTGDAHLLLPDNVAQLSIPQLLILSLTSVGCGNRTEPNSPETAPSSAFWMSTVLQKQWTLLSQPEEERIPLLSLIAYCLVHFWARPFHALGMLQGIDSVIQIYALKTPDN